MCFVHFNTEILMLSNILVKLLRSKISKQSQETINFGCTDCVCMNLCGCDPGGAIGDDERISNQAGFTMSKK